MGTRLKKKTRQKEPHVVIKIYKEVNKPADKLAAMSHNLDRIHVCNSFSELPRQVKGLVNIDRWNLPPYRNKQTKPSNIIYEPS